MGIDIGAQQADHKSYEAHENNRAPKWKLSMESPSAFHSLVDKIRLAILGQKRSADDRTAGGIPADGRAPRRHEDHRDPSCPEWVRENNLRHQQR